MKKLMIAAAAAAMIGGAEAVTAEYDFVAYLTTTTGQPGQDAYAYGAGNVGVNEAGDTMWYNDQTYFGGREVIDDGTPGTAGFVSREWAVPANHKGLKWTVSHSVNGIPYPTLEVEIDKATGLGLVSDADGAMLADLVRIYNQQSFGYWCGGFEWYTKVSKQCFRVFGADSITKKIYLDTDNCCNRNSDGMARAFYSTAAAARAAGTADRVIRFSTYNVTNKDQTYVNGFMNRLGAQTSTDAIYMETFAPVFNVATDYAKLPFMGYLAGQGTTSAIADDVYAPYQFSGSIVGYTDAPVCPDCCVRPLPNAIAFDCVTGVNAAAGDGSLKTAAYGTFYVQYVQLVR